MLSNIEDLALKINNSNKPTAPSKVGQATAKPSGGAAKAPRAKASSDEKVEIGSLSSQLQALESSLDNVQVVDTARVEAIKQAISEGRFRVNPDVVADRLLTTVKELVLNHKG